MGKETEISWCDATFSPWRGCQKVSPGCANCYADAFSHRNPKTLGVFGTEAQGGTRVVAADNYWKEPLKWNRQFAEQMQMSIAGQHGVVERSPQPQRPRVFCASISDVFEDWSGPMLNHKGERLFANGEYEVPVTMADVRARLLALIDATPNLDWLVLTKRPENIRRMWLGWEGDLLDWTSHARPNRRGNTWIGTSVENQEYADKRIAELLKCRDLSPVLFLSCEPLLGPVDLRPKAPDAYEMLGKFYSKEGFDPTGSQPSQDRVLNCFPEIDWVIVGCESGPNRRETKLEWVRSLRDQCRSAGVSLFVKQLEVDGKVTTDMNQFPEDLRIQEFPEVAHAT